MSKRTILALLALLMVTVVCAKKTITSVKGYVCDEAGPLWGATVCEVAADGNLVEWTTTDENGSFTLKVQNPDDRIRISYIGMKTLEVPIFKKKNKVKMDQVTFDKKKYTIKMNPVSSNEMEFLKRQRRSQRCTLCEDPQAHEAHITGTVTDAVGPLQMCNVLEIDSTNHIVSTALTDSIGNFTMKVKNTADRLRITYVGYKTAMLPIGTRTKFDVKLEDATQIKEVRVQAKREPKTIKDVMPATDNGLPIPQREINEAINTIDMSEFEAIGYVEAGEGVLNENNPRGNIPLTDEEQALVKPVNDLGFNMFRKVGAKRSILLSPLGMTYALGLINNGAGGDTRKQISTVLGCNDAAVTLVNNFCRKMLTEAPQLDKLTKMDINNNFFSNEGYTPKPAFTRVARDDYQTILSSVDFSSQKSVDEINQQVSRQSNGMIPQVLDKPSLDPEMGFAFVNVIYFKSVWTDKFRKSLTMDEVFKREDGGEITVPMMTQAGKFLYTENDLCQTLCLPYSNGAFQMIILLPKEGKTVGEVAQSLSADSWDQMDEEMRRVYVDVKLPRFETSSDEDLTGAMKALGMPSAFSVTKANFSNLFDLATYIGMIRQMGRIKVDETGTEATVATLLQGRISGLDLVKPEPIHFYANHPFLYFIRERSTGTIFFIGQYMGT